MGDSFTPWSMALSTCAFVGGALVTGVLGVRLARAGDALADRTRMGEALFGAVFFGLVVSLSGIVMTATAAVQGRPELAYGNAVGGVAAQLLALGAADLAYRHANLEHAAASLPNGAFAVVLACLLCIALGGGFTPELTVWGVHPVSPLLLGAYGFGLRVVHGVRRDPGWKPEVTDETREDLPSERWTRGLRALWLDFALCGLLVAAGGWVVAQAAASIVVRSGLDASFVGAILMGLVNALPETVTAIAAVRRGALTLAISGVLGGNAFDVLNLVVGDVAYRAGSLYHEARPDDLFVTTCALLMTLLLLGGLLRRERRGPLGIGFEGVAMAIVYACLVGVTLG